MLRRTAAVVGMSLAAVAVTVTPAVGDDWWGSVQCGQSRGPGCDLGVGNGGGQSEPPKKRRAAPGPDGTADGRGDPALPRSSNPDLNLASCAYERSDFEPPPDVVRTSYDGGAGSGGVEAAAFAVGRPVAGPEPGEAGAWYVYKCAAGGVRDALYRPPTPGNCARPCGSCGRPLAQGAPACHRPASVHQTPTAPVLSGRRQPTGAGRSDRRSAQGGQWSRRRARRCR